MEKKGGTRTKAKKNTKSLKKPSSHITLKLKKGENRARALKNAITAHDIEEAHVRLLNFFEKFFKKIMENTSLNSTTKDKVTNKLNPDILTKINETSSDVYDNLSSSSKMNENNNSIDVIEIYYNILHDLREMNNKKNISSNMHSNVSMVQSIMAEDLIERFNLENKKLTKTNNTLDGLTGMFGMLNVGKNTKIGKNTNVDDLINVLKKLGIE